MPFLVITWERQWVDTIYIALFVSAAASGAVKDMLYIWQGMSFLSVGEQKWKIMPISIVPIRDNDYFKDLILLSFLHWHVCRRKRGYMWWIINRVQKDAVDRVYIWVWQVYVRYTKIDSVYMKECVQVLRPKEKERKVITALNNMEEVPILVVSKAVLVVMKWMWHWM